MASRPKSSARTKTAEKPTTAKRKPAASAGKVAQRKPTPKATKPGAKATKPGAKATTPSTGQVPAPVKAATTANTGISANGLTRVFGGKIRAVDGIDLDVSEGEIYGFLGPNGAGKSTTVLMLTTLLPLTSGTAIVGGFDVATKGSGVRKVMGAALQDAALDPNLTGREHLKLQGALQGLTKQARTKRAEELLERVGLTEAADRRTAGYSGGMRRRLDLALALVHKPAILFLDEPTTGLDVQSRAALWEEVRGLRAEGTTVFLTTQYLEEADVLADRIGIIHRGKIVAEGTPASLKAEIGRPTVEIIPADPGNRAKVSKIVKPLGAVQDGSARGSIAVRLENPKSGLADVVRVLDRARLEISNLELHAPSLNDVFLAKTGTSLEGAAEQDG